MSQTSSFASEFVWNATQKMVFSGQPLKSEDKPFFAGREEDWTLCLEAADRLQVMPAFLLAVESSGFFRQLPEAVQSEFQRLMSKERIWCSLMEEEAHVAIDALVRAGLKVIALQSVDFSSRLYRERILRPSHRIDLWVPEEGFSHALRVLGSEGYRMSGVVRPSSHEAHLTRRPTGPIVALHSRFLDQDNDAEAAAYWEKSVSAEPWDLPRDLHFLRAEDCLEYLIRHMGVEHLFETPVHLMDAFYLIQEHPSMDWDHVLKTLERKRAVSAGYFVFRFLESEWKAEIPGSFMQELKRRVPVARSTLLANCANVRYLFLSGERTRRWNLAMRWLLQDRFMDAVRAWFQPSERRAAASVQIKSY